MGGPFGGLFFCQYYYLYSYNGTGYNRPKVESFHDSDTEKIFNRQFVKRLHPEIQKKASQKLAQLNRITQLDELKIPPGNKLEPLTGDRQGQHSIRINDQWRVCFVWNGANAERVEA